MSQHSFFFWPETGVSQQRLDDRLQDRLSSGSQAERREVFADAQIERGCIDTGFGDICAVMVRSTRRDETRGFPGHTCVPAAPGAFTLRATCVLWWVHVHSSCLHGGKVPELQN